MSLQTTLMALLTLGVLASAATVNLTAVFGPYLSPGAQIVLHSSANNSEEVTRRWTTWEEPTYIGAIKPASEADVQKIVKIATKNQISFLATGAGHGFSVEFGNVKNAIDIDLGNFMSVEVDASNNRLTVGGAVTFQQVFQPLYNAGKEIQTGNIACVGMVGATIGAGVGPLQGLHGLMIDALESVHLVTTSGDLITVSNRENPDLFWALRGAGANFGIITSANYTIHNATNGGQVLNADFLYPASANRSVFEALASFDESIPAPLGLTVDMSYNQTSKQPFLLVNFIYFGSRIEAQPYLDVFVALNATISKIVSVPWPELNSVTSFGLATRASCTDGVYNNVYSIGLGQTDVPTFESFFSDLAAFSAAHPAYNGVLAVQRYSNTVPLSFPGNGTVYPWRNIKMQLLFINTLLNSSIDADVDTFMQSARANFQKTSGFPSLEVYINYSHGDEGPEVWYGKQNLPRLEALKKKWDPHNYFPGGHPVYAAS